MKLIFESSDLLQVGDAAKALGISTMTLHRWIEKGKIQAVKVGAYRAIPKLEVERLKKERA